jgi:hypothetical protein
MFRSTLIALAAGLALAGSAQAQKVGPNGGILATADGHPIEFVSKDREIVFFLSDDDGKPMSTDGLKGRAVVQDAGKTSNVSLTAVAPNKLVGTLAAPLGKGAKVVMSAKVHDHNLQARFEKN